MVKRSLPCAILVALLLFLASGCFEWKIDNDGDGWLAEDDPARTDCNDNDRSVYPGATEAPYDQIDQDCSGADLTDVDQDGVDALAAGGTDCDDVRVSVYPGATERCDGIDENCDGEIDEGLISAWSEDFDQDGYGGEIDVLEACASPGDGYALSGDCDDADGEVYPGAPERCNAVDDDCDGFLDDEDPQPPVDRSAFYLDTDEDGFGIDADTTQACQPASPYTAMKAGDCDDGAASTYPGALELCNEQDDDCDGAIDEGLAIERTLPDVDGDGYGEHGAVASVGCPGDGRAVCGGDCDDSAADVHPFAPETSPSDGVDQDCGGTDAVDPGIPDPSSSIKSTLALAADGQTIWVGPGRWTEVDLSLEGRAVAVRSTCGAGSTEIDATSLSPGENGTIFRFTSDEGPDTLVEGFTLRGGSGSRMSIDGSELLRFGGGLLFIKASPTLRDLAVVASTADFGGGMYLYQSSPVIHRLELRENVASIDGGGAFISRASAPTMTDLVVVDNQAAYIGGGMSIGYSVATVSGAVFLDNNALIGGGIAIGGWTDFGVTTTLSGVRFAGNQAIEYGGAVDLWESRARFNHITVTTNSAGLSGGGINLDGDSSVSEFSASILAYNDAENLHFVAGAVVLTCSGIYNPDGQPSHNLTSLDESVSSEEPRFLGYDIDEMPTDLHLDPTSPFVNAACLDAGMPDPGGGPPDLGAYGGPDGGRFDVDRDGIADWFWPGSIDMAPAGFRSVDYDRDDRDPAIQQSGD